MFTVLSYEIAGTLMSAFIVAREVESETGIRPKYIEMDGKKLNYIRKDVKDVLSGKIPEDDYIKQNLVL